MNIAPRHNTKLPAYAAAATILAASTMLTGCGDIGYAGGIQSAPPATTEELVLDGEMQYSEPSDLVYEGDMIEEIPVPDPCTSGSEQYDMFMERIDEIEAANPGEFTYSIDAAYDRDNDIRFFILTYFSDGMKTSQVISNGEWRYYYDTPEIGIPVEGSRTYDDIKELPFLTDTYELTHSEITEDEVMFNLYTDIVDSVDDGTYFGRVIGFSEDGTRAFLRIGRPISFDEEEILSLQQGDEIGYYDLVIGDDVSGEENIQFEVESDDIQFADDLRLCDLYGLDNGLLYLCQIDGKMWLTDTVVVEVPVSQDCVVEDTYYSMIDGEIPQDRELTGDRLLDSTFWYYMVDEGHITMHDNGWFSPSATAIPVEITDGQLSYINLIFNYGHEAT